MSEERGVRSLHRGMLAVCVDCRKVLRNGEPKVSAGPRFWRCAECEYHRQRRGARDCCAAPDPAAR